MNSKGKHSLCVFSYWNIISPLKWSYTMLIDKGAIITQFLCIGIWCYQQTGWHTAKDRILIKAIKDLRLDSDLHLRGFRLDLWASVPCSHVDSGHISSVVYDSLMPKRRRQLCRPTQRGVCVNKGHILKLPCGNNATVEDNKRVRHCRWINVLFLNKSGIYIMKKKPCTVT